MSVGESFNHDHFETDAVSFDGPWLGGAMRKALLCGQGLGIGREHVFHIPAQVMKTSGTAKMIRSLGLHQVRPPYRVCSLSVLDERCCFRIKWRPARTGWGQKGLLSLRSVFPACMHAAQFQGFYLEHVTPEFLKQRRRDIREKVGKANAETPTCLFK